MPYYFAGHASLSVISIIMIKIRQRKYTILVAVTVFAFQSCIEIWAELLLEDSLKISNAQDEDLYLALECVVILYRL